MASPPHADHRGIGTTAVGLRSGSAGATPHRTTENGSAANHRRCPGLALRTESSPAHGRLATRASRALHHRPPSSAPRLPACPLDARAVKAPAPSSICQCPARPSRARTSRGRRTPAPTLAPSKQARAVDRPGWPRVTLTRIRRRLPGHLVGFPHGSVAATWVTKGCWLRRACLQVAHPRVFLGGFEASVPAAQRV